MILQLLAAYTASSQQVFNKFFWTIYKRWMYGSMHKLIPFIKLRNWFSWMWGKWIYGRNKDGWVLFICLCERACVCVCSWVRVCACACILSMHISTYAYTYVHMYVNSKIWSVILVNLHRIRIRDPPTWQLPSHVNQLIKFPFYSFFCFPLPFWVGAGRKRKNKLHSFTNSNIFFHVFRGNMRENEKCKNTTCWKPICFDTWPTPGAIFYALTSRRNGKLWNLLEEKYVHIYLDVRLYEETIPCMLSWGSIPSCTLTMELASYACKELLDFPTLVRFQNHF